MDRDVLSLNEIKKEIDKNYIFVKNDMDESSLPFSLQKEYKKITPSFFCSFKRRNFWKTISWSLGKKWFFRNIKREYKIKWKN